MLPDRVKSEFFVGREKEVSLFKSLFQPESEVNILVIHSNGDGGIGKTQLLLRMQEYCGSIPDNVVWAKELIDFYHTENRSRLGVMRQIVDKLGVAGKNNFLKFKKLADDYQKKANVSYTEGILPKLEEVENAFWEDYSEFSVKIREGKKIIVLFFDTYEFIQGTEMPVKGSKKQVEITRFSRWLETQLFPQIAQNTLLVVAGRYPLREIDSSNLLVEEINLSHFTLPDTVMFWKSCFQVETESQLAEKIGSQSLIKTFHTLADGRPILLALFADWMNYAQNPLVPKNLFMEIEQRMGKITRSVTEEQKELFEKTLIERIASLIAPEDRAVTIMAVAYRRMIPELFHFLLSLDAFSLDNCREILLERLKPLSFIKYKKGDVVLLHDEMRRLVVEYWWNQQDPTRNFRKAIAKKLVSYYDEQFLTTNNLLEEDREIYTSELLEYAFLADPIVGTERFCNEFDIALENGRYDYCDLLLREADNYHRENPNDIPFPDHLRIQLNRIRYYTQTNKDYQKAFENAKATLDEYQDNPMWRNSDLHGHFLMECGSAQFSLEKFKDSVSFFEEAKNAFYEVGEDYWFYRASNLIGYAYYRQGHFAEAERYFMQSQKGFHNLLIDRQEGQYRQLLQGLQLSFGNLSMVYIHTGQFDKAIRYAEIALGITRHLSRNTLEIARARTIAGSVLAYTGHGIDARHHLVKAGKLLQETKDRLITGRAKTVLGFLQYRIDEPAYLFEYYRAEEIENIIEEYIQIEDVEETRKLVEEAVNALSEKPVIKKELADAYHRLGELYIVAPLEEHWQKAEKALLASLKWGKESKFLYRKIDTLVTLVILYYFWNGSSRTSEEVKERNQVQMRMYRDELEHFDSTIYPHLFGKYEVVLGDIEFDKALELLRSTNEEKLDTAKKSLQEAFTHYIRAAELMKKFNENNYYLTLRTLYKRLRVLYKRLRVLIEEKREGKLSSKVNDLLNEIKTLWKEQEDKFSEIYQYFSLRIQPKDNLKEIRKLQALIQEVLDEGNFGWALVLNDCLIGAYMSLITLDEEANEYREQLVLRLKDQANYYHALGNDHQAKRCIRAAKREMSLVSDPYLKNGLEGYIDSIEGSLAYRMGKYGEMLEFYLRDQLNVAHKKFENQFPEARAETVLNLLKNGEQKLKETISCWEKNLPKITDTEEKKISEKQIGQYRQKLGETRFRIGEFLKLKEQFEDVDNQKGAFSYLKEAIKDFKEETYLHENVLQSYLNALYFSGNYDHPDYRGDRIRYENHFKEKLRSKSPNKKIYASIMGKLRITQGNALFSSYFERKGRPSISRYRYAPYKDRSNIQTLRSMVRYYVEACNFMAQHSATNFAIAIRVLQRRIEIIADEQSLQALERGLSEVWNEQEYLKNRKNELNELVQFVRIRRVM